MIRGADLWDLMTALAVGLHFQPDAIDGLSLDDAIRWGKQFEKVQKLRAADAPNRR
jgi:hypothetical protein